MAFLAVKHAVVAGTIRPVVGGKASLVAEGMAVAHIQAEETNIQIRPEEAETAWAY